MHQSSLGSMLIAMGYKVHPLWQSLHLQPLLAILTALTMGFAVVVFEASFSAVGFRRPSETPLLAGLGKGIVGLISAYLIVRFGEILLNGKLGLIFAGDLGSLMFLLETVLFVFPLVVLSSAKYRGHGPLLLWASVSMLFAGSLYRFNAFLITYDPGPGYSYFPSTPGDHGHRRYGGPGDHGLPVRGEEISPCYMTQNMRNSVVRPINDTYQRSTNVPRQGAVRH